MAQKKYVSLDKLSTFLDNLKQTFPTLEHTHEIDDITGLTIDAELSATSVNPVQNKIIDAEFEAMSQAMQALDLVVDSKAAAEHSHTIDDIDSLQDLAEIFNEVFEGV